MEQGYIYATREANYLVVGYRNEDAYELGLFNYFCDKSYKIDERHDEIVDYLSCETPTDLVQYYNDVVWLYEFPKNMPITTVLDLALDMNKLGMLEIETVQKQAKFVKKVNPKLVQDWYLKNRVMNAALPDCVSLASLAQKYEQRAKEFKEAQKHYCKNVFDYCQSLRNMVATIKTDDKVLSVDIDTNRIFSSCSLNATKYEKALNYIKSYYDVLDECEDGGDYLVEKPLYKPKSTDVRIVMYKNL